MRMNRTLTAAAILALPVAALAQNPVSVERPDTGKDLDIGHQQIELPQTVFIDQLWIVDTDVVDYGNGDAISGIGIFGVVYDLEVADPFEMPQDGYVTRVVMDYLNFFGGPYSPADDVLVEFFPDAGGMASETPIHQLTGTAHTESGIYVGWWGPCTRVEVRFDECEVPLDAGIWWVSVVPVDTTSGGDWYYVCRSSASGLFDSNLRDGGTDHGGLYGGPYGGGYGSDDWITAGSFGYPGTTSFLVEGEFGNCGGGFVLALNGNCPGFMTACVTGATPGGTVAFVYGACGGATVMGAPCPGLVLNVGGAKLAGLAVADANGDACVGGVVPQAACNNNICVQAIDLATCTVSNVVGPL